MSTVSDSTRHGQWFYTEVPDDDHPEFIRKIVGKDMIVKWIDMNGDEVMVTDEYLNGRYNALKPHYVAKLLILLDQPIDEAYKIVITPYTESKDEYEEIYNKDRFCSCIITISVNRRNGVVISYWEEIEELLNRYSGKDTYKIAHTPLHWYINDTSRFILDNIVPTDNDLKYIFDSISMKSISQLEFNMYRHELHLSLDKFMYRSIPVLTENCMKLLTAFGKKEINIARVAPLIRRLASSQYSHGFLDPMIMDTATYIPYDFHTDLNQIENDYRGYNIVKVKCDSTGEIGFLLYMKSPVEFRSEADTGFSKLELSHILSI